MGAPGDSNSCPASSVGCGAAYVFRQDERLGTWLEEQKLEPQDPAHLDRFGRSLAASEGRVLIGARFDDDNGTSSGSAYVFGFDAASSQWIEQQKLLASDGQGGDQFGRSVALDGDLAIVGAWAANDNSGAAYVFHQNTEGVWSERCKLLPEPNDWTQFFGQAVARLMANEPSSRLRAHSKIN